MHQSRIGDISFKREVDLDYLSLAIPFDPGSRFLQRGNTLLFLGGSRPLLVWFTRRLRRLIATFVL